MDERPRTDREIASERLDKLCEEQRGSPTQERAELIARLMTALAC